MQAKCSQKCGRNVQSGKFGVITREAVITRESG
jgi:hypothetical protein